MPTNSRRFIRTRVLTELPPADADFLAYTDHEGCWTTDTDVFVDTPVKPIKRNVLDDAHPEAGDLDQQVLAGDDHHGTWNRAYDIHTDIEVHEVERGTKSVRRWAWWNL